MRESILFKWQEKVFYRQIGKYVYLTNLLGTKQALLTSDSIKIIELISLSNLISVEEINLKISCEGDNYTNDISSVISELHKNGFIIYDGEKTIIKNNNIIAYAVKKDILNLLDDEFRKVPIPFFTTIELTDFCNLDCIHCYNTKDEHYMSFEAFCNVINDLRKMGTLFINLTGGEVFYHKKLHEMIKYCYDNDLIVSILSNGTNYNEKIIMDKDKCIVKEIRVSLYSNSKDIDESITRCPGSFESTCKTIEIIKKVCAVSISCPILNVNSCSIEGVKDFASKAGINVYFSLRIIAKADLSNTNICYRVSRDDYIDCYNKLIKEVKPLYSNNDTRMVCMGGFNSIGISAEGNIHTCLAWKSNILGNIHVSSILSIWVESPQLELIRKVKRNDFPKCKECSIQRYCRICLANNHNEFGDIFRVNNDFCSLQKRIKALAEQ